MNQSRNLQKQMEPEKKEIDGNIYYIYPFPAFQASNLSGDLFAMFMPFISSLSPAFKDDVMDTDVKKITPFLADAFSTLSGDKMEMMLKKLLLSKNVTLPDDDGGTQVLTEDLSNRLFCANIQHMFLLAFYVIKVNYGDFFSKIEDRFGTANMSSMLKKMGFPATVSLMQPGSTI